MTSLVVGTMTSPPVVDHVHENGSQLVELLPATNDEHGGVIVDMKEAMEPVTFSMVLRASISQWKRQVQYENGPSKLSQFLFIEFLLNNSHFFFPVVLFSNFDSLARERRVFG